MKRFRARTVWLALTAGIGLALGGVALAQVSGGMGFMHGGPGMMHGAQGMGAQGMMPGGGMHDEVNMPGLRGANATPEESADLGVMFANYQTLSRTVEELPNGIRTVTRSSDPQVMETLVRHVTGMIGRVEEGNDPQILIQSPTLDIFFARGEGITSDIEVTDEGIVVVQTSDDPEVVAALHKHAGEVSAMAERGMAAVHEMMMERMAN